jgi:hypothetical protein
MRRIRMVVIDAGEAVHLDIDPSRRDVIAGVWRHRRHAANGFVELDLDRRAGQRVDA